MSVNLTKGDKVNLSKNILTNITVGLGWDVARSGCNIDCDASVLVLRKSKEKHLFSSKDVVKLVDSSDIVYFGNKRHKSGYIVHNGDNLTGAGDGDDEQISVNLEHLPLDIESVVIAVNIYACRERRQHFGMIENCYARVVNNLTGDELCRYNMTEDYSGKTALIVGKFNRTTDGGWSFQAVGEGSSAKSIDGLAAEFK